MSTTDKRKLNPLAIVLIVSSAFFVLFLIVSGILFMNQNKSGWSTSSDSASLFSAGGDAVAVVEIKGVIMDSKKTLEQLKKISENDRIKAVVMRLDSPGGSVAPSQEIYETIRAFKKPVVASMGSIAASGAFYIAMGAKKVYANPGTLTGSVGVIIEFANASELLDWAKLKLYAIKTGKYKNSGAPYQTMSEDARQLFQDMVNNILGQFKRAVAAGRNLPMKQVDAIADGRVFSGEQAKELKLVDELGTFNDAVRAAGELAGIQGEPKVLYPEKKKRGLMDLLLNMPEEESFGSSESSLSDTITALALRLTGSTVGARQLEERLTGSVSPGVYWLWDGAR